MIGSRSWKFGKELGKHSENNNKIKNNMMQNNTIKDNRMKNKYVKNNNDNLMLRVKARYRLAQHNKALGQSPVLVSPTM